MQSAKRYFCNQCGFITTQTTNHYGNTWSAHRWNTCPKCPPYAKYGEFGGQTIWICMEKPMTSADIEALSKLNHYVRQLVCLKQCFGLNAKLGCVTQENGPTDTRRVGTVAELHEIGWCDQSYLVIDHNMHKLETIKHNGAAGISFLG